MTSSALRTRTRAIFFWVAFALSTALLVDVVVEPAFFPTNDGPHHVFGAFARAHIDDPALDFARWFEPNVPASANGFPEIFAALEPLLGWQRAHAWTLAILVVAWALGALALVSVLAPERRYVALVIGASSIGWTLALGFYSYVLGIGLSFAAIALALKWREPRAVHRVALAGALAALALVHFVAAALAGVCVLCVRLASVERASSPASVADARARLLPHLRELALVALTGLPSALLALRAAGSDGNLTDADETAPLAVKLTAIGACTMGGPLWRQLIFAGAIVVSLGLFAARVRARAHAERALALFSLVGCALPMLMPWTFLGWQNAAARALPLAAALALALLPIEKLAPRGRAVAAAACVAFALASTLWARAFFLRASDESADVMRAVRATEASPSSAGAGYRWPFALVSLEAERDSGMLRWDPQRGLGSLFAITQGGFVAYAHVVSPQIHTVLLKQEQPSPTGGGASRAPPPPMRSVVATPLRSMDDPVARARALDVLIANAIQVDGVILIERPEDHARWIARGFTPDLVDARVMLARFTGCSLRLSFPRAIDSAAAAGAAPADLVIRTSLSPAPTGAPVRVDSIDVRAVAESAALLERLPCGPVEVRGCGVATQIVELTRPEPAELSCR